MTSQVVCEWLQSLGYEAKPVKVTLPRKVLVKNGQEEREGTMTLEGAWYLRKETGQQQFYLLGELDPNSIWKKNCFVSNMGGDNFILSGYTDKRVFTGDWIMRKVSPEEIKKIHPFGHHLIFLSVEEPFFEQERKYGELNGEYQMTVEFIEEE